MSLTSLQHLEQKVNHLSEKLNWLLNHLGIDFPEHLNKGISQEQQSSNVSVLCKTENDQVKEKEENQFSSLIKFKGKRSLTSPELKVYPNKKRISSSVVSGTTTSLSSPSASTVVVNCDKLHTIKQVAIPSNRQRQQPNSALEESSSSSSSTHSNNPNTSAVTTIIKPEHSENETTSYIITQNSTEIVQSPTADNEIEIETVKYEPLEVEISSEAHGNIEDGEAITSDSVHLHQAQQQQHHHHHTETRYRIQEENNVLHIIKIESEPSISLDGEHTVINYSEALPIVQIAHDGNSQLSIGEETAIGFLNADGTVTPLNRPNVIINSSSAGLQQFEVLPLQPPTPAKPPVEEIDPKGTFRCQVCNQEFTGLYLFRQHEKKSACRRISRLAQLKKNPPVKNNISSSTNIIGGSIIGKSSIAGDAASWKSYASPAATTNLPDVSPNSPVLKFKCNLCPSNFASAEYLRFHLSKIHNLPQTPD